MIIIESAMANEQLVDDNGDFLGRRMRPRKCSVFPSSLTYIHLWSPGVELERGDFRDGMKWTEMKAIDEGL